MSGAISQEPLKGNVLSIFIFSCPHSALKSFLDAGPLEASGAALLLNLAGRAMARPSTGGQSRAGGELDTVFVHAWRVLGGGQ